jgi:4-hydroxy-tetrahydrodipicolinate reductase
VSENIRVLILGTGQMGSGVARLLFEKSGLELVGAYGRRETRADIDLGRAIGFDEDAGVSIDNDLDAVIERTRPDIAIQATSSRLDDARNEIVTLLQHGVNVISIAEEMAYPAACSPAIASELHDLAAANGVTVLGTGINPGFILDLLIIALSGVCASIESIKARRVNDLSPYGHSVLTAQGVGLSPETFREGVVEGTVAGHIGFPQSIHMIASTLGWDIEQIEETREPIVSHHRRETPFITVEPGQAAGCLHTARAFCRGKEVITLVHPQQIHPEMEGIETHDSIEITGMPNIRLAGTPEIPGGIATVAIAVNMIPRVLNASPGLHTMADLPVPAAILGDARKMVHRPQHVSAHG